MKLDRGIYKTKIFLMKIIREKLFEEEFQFLKGPSKEKILKAKEKILKALEGKSLDYKFRFGIKNDLTWLIQECINAGIDTNKYIIYKDGWVKSDNDDFAHVCIIQSSTMLYYLKKILKNNK